MAYGFGQKLDAKGKRLSFDGSQPNPCFELIAQQRHPRTSNGATCACLRVEKQLAVATPFLLSHNASECPVILDDEGKENLNAILFGMPCLSVDGLNFISGSYYYIPFAVATLDKTCARGTVASVNNAMTGETRIAKDVTNVSTELHFPAQSAPHQESMHLAWKVIKNTHHSGRLIVLHGICVTVYKGHQSQIQNESGIYRQCKEKESK
jgi:hypothetical protein